MLSLGNIRKNSETFETNLKKKDQNLSLEHIIELDKEHRSVVHDLNELRSERNQASDRIAIVKRVYKS